MATPRHFRRLTALFVLLSCADLALTCHLLRLGEGVYEANGLAAAVLAEHGAPGLAAFKALVVLLTGGLVAVIAAYRPRAARGIAAFGCVAVGAVLLYSSALWAGVASQPATARLGVLKEEGRRLDEVRRGMADFIALLERWEDALAGGRCTLGEAVAGVLTDAGGGHGEALARYRRHLFGDSDAGCVAMMLVGRVSLALIEDGSPSARSRVEQLAAAYQAEHGRLDSTLVAQLASSWGGGPAGSRKGMVPGRPRPDAGRRPPGRKARAWAE